MVKINNALFSLNARGTLGKALTFVRRAKSQILEKKPKVPDVKSLAQLSWRHMYLKAVALWHALSAAEKQEWESQARPKHMTGFAWFMSQALKPNPGLYLPLQGGTMSGEILMNLNAIRELPHPTGAAHATRKAYVDALLFAHAALPTVHQDAPNLIALHAALPTVHQDAPNLIALHAAIAAAHHARYTDGEADARIAIHALLAAAHHARYTDGEADARIAIHALLAAAHHARYTDGEAVTAAKTVKLDDFATPDDNTDLNASVTRHGLFKKLSNQATEFLNGIGNWAVPAGEPATKEFFNPVHYASDGSYVGGLINGVGDQVGMMAIVPQDFTSLTSIEVIFMPLETGASMNFVITTFYGAYNGGEGGNVHTETADPRNIGATVIYHNIAHSISDLVNIAALAKGDLIIVQVKYDAAVIDSKAYIKGLRFKYN